MNEVPEILLQAQELQKAGDYGLSKKLYRRFFEENPEHPLRFKALFEVADNCYHAADYSDAEQGYRFFLSYCLEQNNVSEEEHKWIDAYMALSYSRLENIKRLRPDLVL